MNQYLNFSLKGKVALVTDKVFNNIFFGELSFFSGEVTESTITAIIL